MQKELTLKSVTISTTMGPGVKLDTFDDVTGLINIINIGVDESRFLKDVNPAEIPLQYKN